MDESKILHLLDGYIEWNTKTDVIQISDNFAKCLGVSSAQGSYLCALEDFLRNLHSDDRARFAHLKLELQDHTLCELSEIRFQIQSDYLHYDVRASLTNADSIPIIHGVFINIESHFLFQEELKKSVENAEYSSEAKSNFIAHLNHELRTPIGGVMGMAKVLKESSLTPHQSHQVDNIVESAEILLNLVNDVLDISKIAAGKLELDHGEFCLNDVVHKCLNLIRPGINNKSLSLEVVGLDDYRRFYVGDSKRLQQVLLNLLSNATKFTHKGGITLSLKFSENGDADDITFEVKDTGIGIPPEQMQRLFKDFMQGDATITSRYGGTGLGLSICRKLVMLMGGDIDVISAPFMGSTFWFTISLPAKRMPLGTTNGTNRPNHLSIAEETTKIETNPYILVAEDNAINQEVMGGFLDVLSCRYDIASNGVEAVSSCRNKNYDLILMDINMPIMDGLSATDQIRKIPGFAKVPIIAVTADTISWTLEKCTAHGMTDVISKPVSKEKVKGIIDKYMGPNDTSPSKDFLKKPSPEPVKSQLIMVADELFKKIEKSLHGLSQDLGQEKVMKLVEMYQKDSLPLMDTITKYPNPAVSDAAHTLAGMSENLGFNDFGKICRLIMNETDDTKNFSYIKDLMKEKEKLNDALSHFILNVANEIPYT